MAEKNKEKETRSVTPWRPFMGVTERGMDRMLDDFLAGERGHGGRRDGSEPTSWM